MKYHKVSAENIELNVTTLGYKVANASASEQAEFFNGFASGLAEFESVQSRQVQMDKVYEEIDEEALPLLKVLSRIWGEPE